MKGISYREAGVDIDAGNRFVESIKPFVAETKRPGVMENIGGFGGFFDLARCGFKDAILVAATDGVGTKLRVAIEANKLDSIGQDLVAMCVNDLVVQGAEPLFFLDYYACGKLAIEEASIVVKSIALACKSVNVALIGGETAEMPGIYRPHDFDLAGFAVGAVERNEILPKKNEIKAGDILLGLPSSGIHSNGFSLVRKIMEEASLNYQEQAEFAFGKSYGDIFLEPTILYVKPCLALHKAKLVKAFCHITGGGFIDNIPRILPDNLTFSIDYQKYKLPPLFSWLQEKAGLEKEELFRTFNCGIGMVIVAEREKEAEIRRMLASDFPEIILLGEIIGR